MVIVPHYHQAHEALMYYRRNKNARAKAEDILKQYDLGIEKISNDFNIIHNFNDQTLKLHILDESSGTQQLLFVSKMINEALEKGSIAIIDEFDAYLHPTMIEVLVDRFLDKKSNLKGAQLLFSSHNPEVLKQLDKQQIILTKKDKNGASIFKRLDSVKGVRADDNFHNKYLKDDYGYLPDIKKIK